MFGYVSDVISSEDTMIWEEFDVVLVGPKAVGKSALAIRQLKKVFFERYNIPSDDEEEFSSTVSLEQGGRKYNLNILVPPGGMEVQESVLCLMI